LRLQAVLADITTLGIDAIVNAANPSLLGGGGVDGAIHRAAGPRLLAACQLIGGCDIGKACITDGFDLPARYVIHTVGPIWCGGARREAVRLAACYKASLMIAQQWQLAHIAFPCISTGSYGYPFEAAAEVAIEAVTAARGDCSNVHTVTFCCHSDPDLGVYQRLLASNSGRQGAACATG